MKSKLLRLLKQPTPALLLGVLTAWCASFALTTQADTTAVSYSGRAQVVGITHMNNSPDIFIADTGPLPSTGGHIEVSVMQTNMFGFSLEMAEAVTSGEGDTTFSSASMVNMTLKFVVMQTGVTNVVTIESLNATAQARCKPNSVDVSAEAQVRGLAINGQPVEVTGEPNQVINFEGWTMILNEQTISTTESGSSISVVGVRIDDFGCLQGAFGTAEAGITCGVPNPPGDCGKVTGGGWIVGTPTGAKGTFGVSGGIRRGEFWGHLNYIDHGTGMHVRSTQVTGFTFVNDTTRRIDYQVTVDGQPATATVVVADNGEPGRDDTFDLTLSTGYHAGGELGGSRPGGGNIQIHKCPPGWQ